MYFDDDDDDDELMMIVIWDAIVDMMMDWKCNGYVGSDDQTDN